MILTPEQMQEKMDTAFENDESYWYYTDLFDTLAAYAEVVQRVAEVKEPFDAWYWDDELSKNRCRFCDGEVTHTGYAWRPETITDTCDHSPDCLYMRALRLRGDEYQDPRLGYEETQLPVGTVHAALAALEVTDAKQG